MENTKTYRILLSGRVQGVGYRYFVVEKAAIYGIKGYVKNTMDNKVEVVCQGTGETLDIFINIIKKGPAFGHVDKARTEEIENPHHYSSFQIDY